MLLLSDAVVPVVLAYDPARSSSSLVMTAVAALVARGEVHAVGWTLHYSRRGNRCVS